MSTYFAFELLHALNHRPLEIVQDPSAVQEHIARIVEQSCGPVRVGLFEFDKPFALVLVPVAANDFSLHSHIFSQAPDLADLVKVLEDVWGVGEKPRPVRLLTSQPMCIETTCCYKYAH